MDTPKIAAYYKEIDPMKRKALLDRSIAEGEEPEANEVRRKIWETRYKNRSSADPNSRADSFLGLWMVMEFNKNRTGKFIGKNHAKKEILKEFEKTGIPVFAKGSAIEREMITREVLHMVRVYAELCEKDKNYGSTLFGLFPMKENDLTSKLKADLYETAIQLPYDLGINEELALVIKAGRDLFELKYPEDLPLADPGAGK